VGNFRIYIDPSIVNNLVVLNLYDNQLTAAKGYDIYEFKYGNLASTIQIVPPTHIYYIDFTSTSISTPTVSTDRYDWIYLDSTTTSTTLKYYIHKDGVQNNYLPLTKTVSGVYSLIASS